MPKKPKHLLTIDDITPKQQLFVDELIKNWGKEYKTDIVKRVYGEEGKELSTKTASAMASRLTNRKISPHVVAYLEKRKAEEVALYEKDKLRRYKRFEYYANEAASDKQWASAINAEFRSGQLAGLFVDKREVKVSGLEGMSRAELEKKLEDLSKKIDGASAKTIEAKVID